MISLYAKQIGILAYLLFSVTVGVKLMQCSTRSANTLYSQNFLKSGIIPNFVVALSDAISSANILPAPT